MAINIINILFCQTVYIYYFILSLYFKHNVMSCTTPTTPPKNLHHHVSVTLVTIIRVWYNKNTINMAIQIQIQYQHEYNSSNNNNIAMTLL